MKCKTVSCNSLNRLNRRLGHRIEKFGDLKQGEEMVYYFGVDLHKTQFTVHERTKNSSENIDEIVQYETSKSGYESFLERIRFLREKGNEVRVGVESTGNTRFFKNKLEESGAKVTVINTLKFKVINESSKKTDKHDAATISEFLSKEMLPESYLCSKETENIRRLLKSRTRLVRSIVGQKNEVHALLVSLGINDEIRCLQSRKGRQKVLSILKENPNYKLEALSVQLIFEIIEEMQNKIKEIEAHLEEIMKNDQMVNRLLTIRGCGKITAWIIRAYTEDIERFSNSKRYASFCGLVPWVQDSNKTVHHGKITKRGPQELRTAYVQLVMGIRRCKDTTEWRIMQKYEHMKKNKGSGKTIVAAARKMAETVWNMLYYETDFCVEKMQYSPGGCGLIQ